MRRCVRHYVDHALLGALIFVAGVVFNRTATYHHGRH